MLLLDDAPRIPCNSNVRPLHPHRLVAPGKATQEVGGDILIIEDHAMILSALQASLRRFCPNVEQVCVRNAKAALEVIDSRPWLRVFIDPDATGVDEGLLVHEFARLGLGRRCCLISTRPRQRMKRRLRGLECLTCISTRMPIEEFHEALARAALGIAPPKDVVRVNPVPHFTPRHVELLRLLQRGLQNKVIAHELGIAEGTVRNHLHSLMKRLGVRNRMQAVQEAARFGIAW